MGNGMSKALERRISDLEKEVSRLKERLINQPTFEEMRDSAIDIFIEEIRALRKMWGKD